MKTKSKFSRSAVLALVLGLSLAAAWPALAHPQGQQPPQQPGQQPPPQPPSGQPQQPGQTPQPPAAPQDPPVNAEEEAAFKAFTEVPMSDLRRQIELGEEFLGKFPASRYRETVYAQLTGAYLNTQQEEKMFAAGEKALELNPNNVDVLALMAVSLPRRIRSGDLDAAQKLERTERYARHGIELLEEMPKPERLGEEEFNRARNEKMAMCHSGLGLVHLHRQRWADAVGELEKAVSLSTTPEPVDLYLLGVSYEQSTRFADAADAYRRCVEVNSPLLEQCKQGETRARQRAGSQLAPPR